MRLHQVQLVGTKIEPNLVQLSRNFVYCCFCPPGKHSVFIYDPEKDRCYKKIIAVEPRDSFVNRQILLNSIVETEVKENKISEKKLREYNQSMQKFMPVKGTNEKLERVDVNLIECFMNDSQPLNMHIEDIVQPDQVRPMLDAVWENFRQICDCYKGILGRTEAYPILFKTDISAVFEELGLSKTSIDAISEDKFCRAIFIKLLV